MSFRWSEPDPFPPTPTSQVRIVAAARSDAGRVRPNNEDRALLGDASGGKVWEAPAGIVVPGSPSGFFALVCDGMGGEAGGEVASSLAAQAIAQEILSTWTRPRDGDAVGRVLVGSIETASLRVREVARQKPVYARMGTTATVAAFAEDTLVCAQVGDSRAYLHRDGRLTQLTRDQTLAEYLRASGAENVDVVALGAAHVILQAVGSSQRLEVVVTAQGLVAGDAVLLCSDGLFGEVSDGEIAEILSREVDPERACEALVASANDHGGGDNVTCVVARVLRT